jgi:DNA-binding LacI/PurR family transcriptional regulator
MTTEKEVTIYDLAKKLNISIATVSRALKDDPVVTKKTKKRIAELAEEMGCRSNNFVPKPNSYFMSTVIAGIENAAIAARALINHLNDASGIHSTNTIILRSELVIRASSVGR